MSKMKFMGRYASRRAIAPPGQEGWREAPGWLFKKCFRAGTTTPSARFWWLREIFLIAQPPLLARRGDRSPACVTVLMLALLIAILSACSPNREPDSEPSTPAARTTPVSLSKDDYPVFPDKDAGVDPSVPADQGGKDFTGDGWETNSNFDFIGDPTAVKGGMIRDHMISFPGTLRMAGPEWNTEDNYLINALVNETLLTLHPTTLQYMPLLATHWKVDPDKLTFRFRIDPNARFSDGTPVTSEDVIATWKFLTDKTLQDAYFYTEYNKLEMPAAESKYIVRFKAKELAWENFLVAASIRVFPARVLNTLNGASYLKDYNFKLLPGTGPYILKESDIQKGQSITLRRRKDYWAEKYRINVGQNNFDEIKRVVVRDENLAIEMLKKGQLDYYYVVGNPKVWVEQFNGEPFQRGLIAKTSFFNNTPASMAYIGFNTRRKPFDDVRVRKALTLLFNRKLVIEKLFHSLYLPENSYYPATVYENPNNPKNEYNPQESLKLLSDAGWKDHDSQGRLIKDGQPLQLELIYARQVFEPWLTVYQEELRRVGITLHLRLVTFETAFSLMMKRKFDFIVGAWGAGSVFPNPRPEYHSSMADREDTNNITGLKDKRVDELVEKYDVTFDPLQRVEQLKELDGLLTAHYHYMLRWYDPAQRIAYTNKFGMPKGSFSRVGDYLGTLAPGIPQLWWVDPDKAQKLERAMRDNSIKLDVPPVDDKYWQEQFGKAQKEMDAQPHKP